VTDLWEGWVVTVACTWLDALGSATHLDFRRDAFEVCVKGWQMTADLERVLA
jgi:hypothetical protein